MLSVTMRSVVMLNVVMLSVVMLNVVAPKKLLQSFDNLKTVILGTEKNCFEMFSNSQRIKFGATTFCQLGILST
jgi:hypothetical protein